MKVKLLRVTENGVELVARSARVSGVPEGLSDEEVVRMIVENDYSSALEHIVFTFDVSGISVAISRELLEHRIASHTARSTRYNRESGFEFVNPAKYLPEEARKKFEEEFLRAMEDARSHYQRLYEIVTNREGVSPLRLCCKGGFEVRAPHGDPHSLRVDG